MKGFFFLITAAKDTLVLSVYAFRDLYDGPIFQERATGTEECPGYCLRKEEFRRCPARCECNYVREIVQRINTWPKK